MKKYLPLLLLAIAGVGIYFYTRAASVKIGTVLVGGREISVVKADPLEIEAA